VDWKTLTTAAELLFDDIQFTGSPPDQLSKLALGICAVSDMPVQRSKNVKMFFMDLFFLM
jgi:hypothetical protein